VTVLEVIQRSTEFLARKGVEAPRLHGELLLAHVLKVPRMKLYLDYDRTVDPAQLRALRELLRRRGQREPLQHIVGTTSFCGLELEVNRAALIPRQETELLAERGWEFLRRTIEANQSGKTRDLKALDFGTGTGCLAIALAVKCPEVEVVALDVSAEALELAAKNAARHSVLSRIQFLRSTGLSALPRQSRFDLIIANPPYIPSAEISTLQPEVRDFDPRLALDGGVGGLDFYTLLSAQAGAFLKSGGKLMLEFGDGQAEELRRIFTGQNWIVEEVIHDYTHRARILIASQPETTGGAA
jgi:release factor glutamine methyltransferase